MCSIIGSASVENLNTLKVLNEHRGALSHSIAMFSSSGALLSLQRNPGPMSEIVYVDGVTYTICHQQAPTTQESDTIHPSSYQGNLLWHNGIVKSHYLRTMIDSSGDPSQWDTHQINIALSENGVNSLDSIEGSFTCVWYNTRLQQLYMFRNAISPLFSDGSNISSVRFGGSKEIENGKFYSMNFKTGTWELTMIEFDNVETPFFYFD